jgi:hypothetical protein
VGSCVAAGIDDEERRGDGELFLKRGKREEGIDVIFSDHGSTRPDSYKIINYLLIIFI